MTTASPQKISLENTIITFLKWTKTRLIFHELNDKITNVENNNQKTTQDVIVSIIISERNICYGKLLMRILVIDKIREQIPDQDKPIEAKRKERLSDVGSKKMIDRIKSFSVSKYANIR